MQSEARSSRIAQLPHWWIASSSGRGCRPLVAHSQITHRAGRHTSSRQVALRGENWPERSFQGSFLAEILVMAPDTQETGRKLQAFGSGGQSPRYTRTPVLTGASWAAGVGHGRWR